MSAVVADPLAEFLRWLPYGMTCARRAACGYPSLHDDIASELAFRLWRLFTATAIDERGPRRLVAVVARRVARSVVARSRRQFRTFRQPAPIPDGRGDALDFIPSRDPDPADAALVADALAAVDPATRADAMRHFLEGETWDAIGAERGVTGAAVRQRVALRLDRLR